MGIDCRKFLEIKDDLVQIKDQADKVILNKNMKLVIRAKVDQGLMMSDKGSRVRYAVVRAIPHDFKSENADLLKKLDIYKNK